MTVDELRQRMSVDEFRNWMEFERIAGPLHPMLRIDAAVARAVAPFLKRSPDVHSYLMPWPKEVEEEQPSAEEAFKLLMSIHKGSRH